jgi:predicted RNA-binding Zn ribbon-like protein
LIASSADDRAFQRPDDPVELAVALANTWDTREDPSELLENVATLEHFLRQRNVLGADALTARDLDAVRAVRDQLRAAFGARDETSALEILNEVLDSSRASAELQRDRDEWHVRYTGAPVDVVASTSAASLQSAIRVDGWDRLGICAAAPCSCVFVDRSRNHSRRFCSELCANRYAQASHRRRVRQSDK